MLFETPEQQDERFMRIALQEASQAAEEGEIPVGAVIVQDGQLIARAHNMTERLRDVTAHAEMQAITAAAMTLGGKYLQGCTLYVTVWYGALQTPSGVIPHSLQPQAHRVRSIPRPPSPQASWRRIAAR